MHRWGGFFFDGSELITLSQRFPEARQSVEYAARMEISVLPNYNLAKASFSLFFPQRWLEFFIAKSRVKDASCVWSWVFFFEG